MSDTLQEVDTSDDEIAMFDPFDSEEVKDVSSDDDIKIVPRKKDKKSIIIDEPENLVEATLSESEEVILMDPFEEQASPKEEDRVKVSSANEEEVEEEEITLVELDTSSVERREGEIFLAPRSKDKDHGAIRRKRQRAKKVNVLSCYFYRTQVSLGSDLWVWFSLTKGGFANLTDVTLADEDTN